MRNDFAIFIMSYNRAGNIATLRTLEKANYTGKYYIIISDDDPQIDKYKETYNDKLYIFNKDKIGGLNNDFLTARVKRKAMNSFFCKTDNPFIFSGRINEDVNTYIGLGKIGNVFLTFCDVSLKQKHTQQNKGGMTDTYNEDGTYLKSFYTVLANPSCVVVAPMGDKHIRFHHRINWNNAVPKIISDKYKK